ncbi:MAG: hypothetical protein WB919_23275 [Candidatus Sulfotelmatobacter sp.]
MKPQPAPAKPHPQIEIVRLMWLAIFISVFSFLFYYRDGSVLLYGDAVAHINIARRVFDSRTPGLLQLGTVWLPLPHLLILPFIVSKQMWQSGSGGSIPSMAAFVLGVLGIFRLVRVALGPDGEGDYTARIGSWSAALLYAANPNLIYMQATAMGESLYLACFIWAVACFAEFVRGNPKALTKCGLCLAAASLTRYDGWFLAVLLVIAVIIRTVTTAGSNNKLRENGAGFFERPATVLAKFILIAAAGPILWLAYNAAVYRNPLEFANGPYSAKAIERNTATVNPAKGNMLAAGSYFLKAAELNVSESDWPGRLWLALALLGSLATTFRGRGRSALLLWAPLPFYALSVAYGSVTIFLPSWWPFSIYNVRYGLELLPAFAVFAPLGISFLIKSVTNFAPNQVAWRRWSDPTALLGILLLAASSYAAIWRAEPICYREADINSRGRIALDRQLGDWITKLPPNSDLLMYLGQHVGALEQAGIPLRRTINEGNHRVWKQPTDAAGLWERALANPAAYADYVVGFEGDPAWKAAEDRHLTALVEIHTTGQPAAVIFQTRPQTSAQGGAR